VCTCILTNIYANTYVYTYQIYEYTYIYMYFMQRPCVHMHFIKYIIHFMGSNCKVRIPKPRPPPPSFFLFFSVYMQSHVRYTNGSICIASNDSFIYGGPRYVYKVMSDIRMDGSPYMNESLLTRYIYKVMSDIRMDRHIWKSHYSLPLFFSRYT